MIIVADVYDTTLTLTVNGPDYNGIFDLVDDQEIVIDHTDEILTVGGVICRR